MRCRFLSTVADALISLFVGGVGSFSIGVDGIITTPPPLGAV
ncbi:MAG: hypothetical protein RSA27_03250 [Oscillospiraceae bacterium]